MFALISTVSFAADEYHLTLLAVQELPDGSHVGSTADLFVEVQPGSGRVFLDTTPLTKLDTQVSTRYAKQVACEYYSLDCNNYDFFYAIRSETSIVGGPSAGAAMAALTALAVMDLDYDDSVALTGTINSGGTVGPVGGVKEKIVAADSLGLGTVLVPLTALAEDLSGGSSVETNESLDAEEVVDSDGSSGSEYPFGENPFVNVAEESNYTLASFVASDLSISAFEVSELDDVLFHLTGERYLEAEEEFEVNLQYESIMERLQKDLCLRARSLEQDLLVSGSSDVEWDYYEERFGLVDSAASIGDNYASASFCFGLNSALRSELLKADELDFNSILLILDDVQGDLNSYSSKLDSMEMETISDLQTFIVVSDRISDAQERLDALVVVMEALNVSEFNSSLFPYHELGFIIERAYSAQSWMLFFEMSGRELELSNSTLSEVCGLKLAEAEERYNYASVYVPFAIENIFEKIELGKNAQSLGDYPLCISQAAQAKGESSSILSSVGLPASAASEYLLVKENAASRVIAKNSEKGMFPILGYSYYQYAGSLAETEPYSALLYYEYALEMGELGLYFEDEKNVFEKSFSVSESTWIFLFGLLNGIVIGGLLVWLYFQGSSRRKD